MHVCCVTVSARVLCEHECTRVNVLLDWVL